MQSETVDHRNFVYGDATLQVQHVTVCPTNAEEAKDMILRFHFQRCRTLTPYTCGLHPIGPDDIHAADKYVESARYNLNVVKNRQKIKSVEAE